MASAMHLHKLLVRNTKLLKSAWKSLQQNLANRLAPLEPIPLRVRVTSQQPLHPIAAIRQQQSRWAGKSGSRYYTTSSAKGPAEGGKSTWPTSATRTRVERLTARAPFASTLRPNLTGGAFPRSAGGYSLGGGAARHFSHTPAAPAQIVQNVSQAVRAFCLSGHRAQFAGTDPVTGEKLYRAVSTAQAEAGRRAAGLPIATPGSYVDFRVNPTITALTPLSSIAGYAGFDVPAAAAREGEATAAVNYLNTSGLLDVLSVDFSRALKDLAAILGDLKALSGLGDLPITYRADGEPSLRIHFPGCDADTVETLCRELGVKRGVVRQDEAFDAYAGTEIALLFPFAPSEGDAASLYDERHAPHDYYSRKPQAANVWLDDPLFPSPRSSEIDSALSRAGYELFEPYTSSEPSSSPPRRAGPTEGSPLSADLLSAGDSPLEYRDFEGIYRFIELCDDARR